MDVVELTGAIEKETELSDERLLWGFCPGLDEDEEKDRGKGRGKGGGKGGRPSAPSSTGCFQDGGEDECKCGGCLLTRSQNELGAFNLGRRPSMQS